MCRPDVNKAGNGPPSCLSKSCQRSGVHAHRLTISRQFLAHLEYIYSHQQLPWCTEYRFVPNRARAVKLQPNIVTLPKQIMASQTVLAASVAAATLVSVIVWRLVQSNFKPANFPPGPASIPILGNLHQIPQGLPFLAFDEWAQKYGPIVGFKLGSQNAVVIHEASLVHELIVKKGSVMSSRPPRYVAQEHVIPEGKHIHPVFMRNDYAMKLRSVTKDYLIAPGLHRLAPVAKAIGMRLVYDIYKSDGNWTDDLAQWYDIPDPS
jgi:hypothetical protein